MKRTLFVLIFTILALNIALATTKTVCDGDCDYESLKEAIKEVNNTDNSIVINSPGVYSMNSSLYQTNTTGKAIEINSSDVWLNCNNSLIQGNNSGEGIYTKGKNITIEKCHIKDFSSRGIRGENLYNSRIINTKIEEINGKNGKGVLLNTANNNSIINSSIKGNDSDIETSGEGYVNYIINSTFGKEELKPRDNSELIIKWYLNVNVTANGDDIEDATVNITNQTNNLVSSFTTNEDGKTQKKEYPGFMVNESGEKDLSAYSIFATNSTHYATKEIELTSSRTTGLELTQTAPDILNIKNSTTNESVTISFETDKDANSSVEFAKVGLNGDLYEFNQSTTRHGKTIKNLQEQTKYSYIIKACDEFNFCTEEGPFNVTTNSTLEFVPPKIDFKTPKEDNSTVYDRWINQKINLETNEPSECLISQIDGEFEDISSLSESILKRTDKNKTHSIMFNATDDGQDFFVEVSCVDYYNNEKSKQVSFSVNDTTRPYLSFMDETIESRGYTNKDEITIYIKSEDGLDENYPLINLNEKENHSMTQQGNNEYNYTFSDLGEDKHKITVYARNKKGNLRERSRTFTTDYTPPELDINMPDANYTFEDKNIVEANLTIDKEDIECEYELFNLKQEELDECVNGCEEEHDDCMDDAETTDEEDECEQELEECIDECDDDKYSEEDDDEIELYMDIDDCKDKCDRNENRCIDECKGERESCFDLYDDKSICYDDYDDCKENCQDDRDDCRDECEEMDFTYFKEFDTHFNDGEYLFKFMCEDKAGNKAKDNSTFFVNDITPPNILRTAPNGTIEETPVVLNLKTSELSICRYDKEDIAFEQMNNTFGRISKNHADEIKDLSEGEHTFYVNCNDTNGNIKEENQEISFELSLDGREEKEDENFFSKIINKLSAGNDSIINVEKENFSLQEISINTNEDVEDVEIKLEEMKNQDAVELPENKVYKYFTISKIGLENEQIENINLTFRVENSWLDNNNIQRLFLKHYTDAWNEETTTKLDSDGDYTYYSAKISNLSMFSIIGEKEDDDDDDEETQIKENETQDPDVRDPDESNENETQDPEVDSPEEIEPISFDNLWLWILLVGVLVVGGGAVVFFVYGPNRHPQQDLKGATAQEQPTLTQAAAENSAAATLSKINIEKKEQEKMDEKEEKQNEKIEETPNKDNKKDPLIKYVLECHESGWAKDEIMNSLIQEGYSPIDVQETLISAGLMKDEVKEYITKAIEAGQNEDYIKGALLRNGFEEEFIERKINEIKAEYVENHFKKDAERKQKQKEDNLKKSLETYVKNALETGMTQEDVKKVLLDMGHDFKDVDNAIEKIEEPKKEAKEQAINDGEKESQNVNESEVDRELIDYVKQCMDSKLSKYHITKILKDAGYEKSEIKEALKIAEKEKK